MNEAEGRGGRGRKDIRAYVSLLSYRKLVCCCRLALYCVANRRFNKTADAGMLPGAPFDYDIHIADSPATSSSPPQRGRSPNIPLVPLNQMLMRNKAGINFARNDRFGPTTRARNRRSTLRIERRDGRPPPLGNFGVSRLPWTHRLNERSSFALR